MKKRIICMLLAALLIVPFVFSAQAAGSDEASIAVYVNGNWVAAKSLSGISGDVWLEFPIDRAVLTDSDDANGGINYVRMTSNVANGETADTQINLLATDCGYTNTFLSPNWYVDGDWSGLGTVDADIAIEGWNGSQWIRIHNDHACLADTSLVLGNYGDTYKGYAKNIWTPANTLANYTNFRIRAHMNIGSNLTLATGDILNLFPAANYHACTFCPTCGGCENGACTLNHVACTCTPAAPQPCENPSIAIWVNGNWVAAKSLDGISGDNWIEFPIDGAILKDSGEGTGATNYVRIASNVVNGATADTQLVLLGSNTQTDPLKPESGWSNTFISHNWWVDSDWAGIGNVNADLAIEGWNGSQWIRIHNDHDCVADTSLILGNVGGSDFQGYARNIWTDGNTLANYTNFRIRAHMNIGSNLTLATGDILNLFPAANYHACTFCPTCGGCLNADCALNHAACTCTVEPEPAEPYETPSVAIWVNGNWVAAKSLTGVTGDNWIEFPIDGAILKDFDVNEVGGATNYVRIASNVVNGATADTQLAMLGSDCGWSNTLISHNWWVDSDWAGIGNVNADLAIEGWNGSQWIRIHNDHDCVADTSLILGNVGGSDFQGYARNIWTDNNTLANYTNFRIVVHMNIGSNLTVATGDILNLFPVANYLACTFCPVCGGCLNEACTLNHVPCTCSDEPEPEAPVLEIKSAYLRINENINVVYAAEVPEDCTDPYMVFNFLGRDITVTDYTESDGKLLFELSKVVPQCMGDNISATLYATKNGETVTDTIAEYSVKTYCENQLAKTNNAKLRTLLSDILVYGAAAQTYIGYKTDALVTSGLDLTPSTFTALEKQKAALTGEKSEAADWTSATIGLSNELMVRFYFTAASTDGLSVDVTVGDRTESFDADDFGVSSSGKYYVTLNGIKATEFNEAVTATFKQNGTAIGRTASYSVNGYISNTQDCGVASLEALVKALYNYGASARSFAQK